MANVLTDQQCDDIRFLRETSKWPYYPFLPMKRGKENGICWDGPQDKRVVYLGNIFSVIADEISLATLEKIEYNSSYDLVMDGWTVD